jgi:hypothetical protein
VSATILVSIHVNNPFQYSELNGSARSRSRTGSTYSTKRSTWFGQRDGLSPRFCICSVGTYPFSTRLSILVVRITACHNNPLCTQSPHNHTEDYLELHVMPSTCKWQYTLSTWSTGVGMGLAERTLLSFHLHCIKPCSHHRFSEVILVIRTHAIYDRSRAILYSLGTLWIVRVIFCRTGSKFRLF